MLCVQANVLHVLYKHVPFSMYPKHEPQPHSETQSGCACIPEGFDFQNMALIGIRKQKRFGITILVRDVLQYVCDTRAWETGED